MPKLPAASAGKFTTENVIAVRHWTPKLVSFRTSRNPGFRFTPGHYTRIGLDAADGTVVWRPLSVVSATYDAHLEFVAVLVPDGEFSGRLAGVREGAAVHVDRASSASSPSTISRRAKISGCWRAVPGSVPSSRFCAIRRLGPPSGRSSWCTASAMYRAEIAAVPCEKPLMPGSGATAIRTRRHAGIHPRHLERPSIPRLIEDGQFESAARVPLDRQRSRIMVCGNPDTASALRRQLSPRDFQVNRRAAPRAARIRELLARNDVMTFAVTESCIRCKHTDCVDVCPTNAFREGPNSS